MRIIQVGDVANVGRELIKGLRRRGEQANLLLMPKPGDNEPSQEGVEIIRTPLRALTHTILLSKLLGRYRHSEIFHAHALYNILLAGMHRLTVAHFHGDDLLEVASSGSRLGRTLVEAMKRSRRILVSTPDLPPVAASFGIERAKITFLPNPIDTDIFRPLAGGERLPGGENTIKLFHPTRFQDKKHNERLLEALARLQDKYPVSLYLIEQKRGSPLHARMTSMIAELGLRNVIFLPKVPHAQLAGYYNSADIVLDQFDKPINCLVALEAMACGKPVVSGFPDKGDAYPEPPPVLHGFSTGQIEQSLSWLFENRDRWDEIGRNGTAWIAANHAMSVVVPRLIEIYRNALAD